MNRFTRVSRIRETGSTNDDMAAMLGEERARGLTLVADFQRSGSGRKGRAWVAPPGSALLCTIGLPDPLPTANLWAVPFWTALTLADSLDRLGIETKLQWPNDVLLGARKVAGILCISRVMGDQAWAGCGIGVNIRRPDSHAIADIDPPPAYLSDELPALDRETVLSSLLQSADERYHDLQDTARIIDAWQHAAHVPGEHYRIQVDGEQQAFDATALRLLPGGALLVDHHGAQREISLADARVLRA